MTWPQFDLDLHNLVTYLYSEFQLKMSMCDPDNEWKLCFLKRIPISLHLVNNQIIYKYQHDTIWNNAIFRSDLHECKKSSTHIAQNTHHIFLSRKEISQIDSQRLKLVSMRLFQCNNFSAVVRVGDQGQSVQTCNGGKSWHLSFIFFSFKLPEGDRRDIQSRLCWRKL